MNNIVRLLAILAIVSLVSAVPDPKKIEEALGRCNKLFEESKAVMKRCEPTWYEGEKITRSYGASIYLDYLEIVVTYFFEQFIEVNCTPQMKQFISNFAKHIKENEIFKSEKFGEEMTADQYGSLITDIHMELEELIRLGEVHMREPEALEVTQCKVPNPDDFFSS